MELDVIVWCGIVYVFEGCEIFLLMIVVENIVMGVYISIDCIVIVVDEEMVYVYFLILKDCCI